MSMNYREKVQSLTSSSDDDSLVILDTLASPSSKYFVKSILGEGSFGTVTKCIKAATKGTVAVKIMKKRSLTSEAQNEMAILEYLRAFDSDRFNFVKWTDSFIDREHVCIEFELLDISLFDFMRKKHTCCLSVNEIRPILYQVATTLEFLRNLGLVHTDLKPNNIMMVDHVNQPLKVKMIDFGLARHVSQSQRGSYLQPRYYRSPEVILGLPYTTAIDIWSLGCIAAELFLGNVLYPGDSEYDMLRHITQTQGQLPQELLNNGLKTEWFFRRKMYRQRQWTLKTPFEYGRAVFTETHFNSLDDLNKVKPVCHLSDEDNRAEITDRETFVDLLKKMLQLDVSKRITPSQILEDLFITMTDLAASYPNSLYSRDSNTYDLCRTPGTGSPKRKRMRMDPLHDSKETPFEVQACVDDVKPQKKRKRDTFTDSHLGSPRSPDNSSPKRKRMRMDPLHDSKETPFEVQACVDDVKPQKKRKRDTFTDSHLGSPRSPDNSSPKRKRMRMDPLHDSKETPFEVQVVW
uniref:homeodomain-interacting protein kinase 1-like n=1 Tax=Scatophagus argus TaxID=75038 RepID=UPI001ED80ECE|nr:homeodomain-interacting protein kinase 1-like [Scatophagus argus]